LFEADDEGAMVNSPENEIAKMLLSVDGVGFLYCKKCEEAAVQLHPELNKKYKISLNGEFFNCLLGKVNPSSLELAYDIQVRDEISFQQNPITSNVNLQQNQFLLIAKSDGSVVPCESTAAFPEDFCSLEQFTISKAWETQLLDEITKCTTLTDTQLQDILEALQSEARPNQQFELSYGDAVYGLNDQRKLERKASPLSDQDINAGNWSDGIDMKMRIGFDADGILQFKAIGIRGNLPLATGKAATLTSISQNMLTKNNALLKRHQVKDINKTSVSVNATLDSDAFPDGKKVDIDENATFIKILCEAGGIGLNFLKTAKIEQPVYTENEAYTVKAPPIVTGITESVGMVVTDITSAASMIHDLVTDEQAQKAAVQGLVEIKNQVSDDPAQLFPILKELVLEEFTGSSSDEFTEVNANGTNEGRRQHIVVKTGVRTASNVFSSGKFIVKLPEMAKTVAFKMAKSKSFLKFKKLPNVPDEVFAKFQSKLKGLPDGGEKFLDDFKDVSDDVRKEIVNDPDLIDSWKELDEDGLDKSVKTNIESLKNPDTAREAVEQSGKPKPTWPEIQALFKRGNDFNRKAGANYQFNEVTIEHPTLKYANGKPRRFRLDSYNDGAEIVSRKATDLAEIQQSTFENYLSELIKKYPPGAKIVTPQSAPQINGKVLGGNLKLEIPSSNRSFNKIEEYIKIAQTYKIDLIFSPE
jgi:hypothetical protein